MRELGRRDAEALEDQQMLEGVGEVILAADDVRDAQVGVVGAGGQVIGGIAVRAQQGKVLDLVGELGLRAINGVGKAERAALDRAGRDSGGRTARQRRRGGRSPRGRARAFRD